MNSRNLGFFKMEASYVYDNPDEVAEIFSRLKIVPVKVEYRLDTDSFEYLAVGERFEILPNNMMAPEYKFQITKSAAGDIELIEVMKS